MRSASRKLQERRSIAFARGRRTGLEILEARLVLTWGGIPPALIAPPAKPTYLTLAASDATGSAAVTRTEVDDYAVAATRTGMDIISTTTPASNLDTVVGIFNANGQRIAYNDDISSSNSDSRATVNLTVGGHYFL